MSDELRQARQWFERAHIDYIQYYMSLYASFNAWYRVGARTMNDREAINKLRLQADALFGSDRAVLRRSLVPHMLQLVELTQREPLSYASPHWRGEVGHVQDWLSLLEYWYRVRCLVMHGAEIKGVYVYLAYQSLEVFMSCMLSDPQDCFFSNKVI